MSTTPDQREYLQTLAKGLAVIEAFGAERSSMTLSEVARQTGISPGAARRVLHTLQLLGYVAADGTRFALQPRTLRLGFSYLSSLPLNAVVQPWLTQLTREMDESCSLAVLDGEDVVFIARAAARRLDRDYMTLGMRYPANSTSAGKLLLAYLPPDQLARRLDSMPLRTITPHTITDRSALKAELKRIRYEGLSTNNEECYVGLRSLAVPVRVNGQIAAALTTSSHVARCSMAELISRHLPLLRNAAQTLEEIMAARQVPLNTPLDAFS